MRARRLAAASLPMNIPKIRESQRWELPSGAIRTNGNGRLIESGSPQPPLLQDIPHATTRNEIRCQLWLSRIFGSCRLARRRCFGLTDGRTR